MSTAPAPAPTPLLVVHGLTVRFGAVTANDRMALAARGGEVTRVIGPNGAGKSTLLDAIGGFIPRPKARSFSMHTTSLGSHHTSGPAKAWDFPIGATVQRPHDRGEPQRRRGTGAT